MVKFEITYNGGADTATEIFNFNEEPSATVLEWMDLGTYNFTGNGQESVVVTNMSTSTYMRVSSVMLTPSAATSVLKADRGGIIITEPTNTIGSWSETNSLDWLVNPTGGWTRWSLSAANHAQYSAASLSAGYYRAYLYKAVYVTGSTYTPTVDMNIYHGGRHDAVTIDYAGTSVNTTVWQELGTYYFSGGSSNEYITVQNTTQGQILRLGGVKFVPVAAPTENYEEVIVRATDEAHTSLNGFSWPTSTAVAADDGSESRFSTAQGASFTFYADQLSPGSYQVYYYRPVYKTANDDDNVWLTVNHNSKTDAFSLNHRVGKQEWVYVGDYDFVGGTQNEGITVMRVQAHDQTTVSTRVAAVKFVKNAPAESDTYAVAPSNQSGANLLAVGTATVSTIDELTHEGVFSYYIGATNYQRYYLSTAGAKPGVYDVYLTALPYGGTGNGNNKTIAVTVTHNGRTDETTFDGTQARGYYKIGSYAFAGRGNDEYVEVNANGTLTRLGAVKFVRTGDLAQPETGKLTVTQADFGSGISGLSAALSVGDRGIPLALRAAVYNDSGAEVTDVPTVYAAVYGTDGRLADIVTLTTGAAAIAPGETAHYAGTAPWRVYTVGERLAMFIWEDGLKPLASAAPLTVTE